MIYLVRHGETTWNSEGRYQGSKDSPLTEAGLRMAEDAGRALRALLNGAPEVRIVSSHLGRAKHTAQLIAAALPGSPDVHIDTRLAEIDLGDWEALTDEEIEVGFPGARDGMDRWNWFFNAPGGERYDAFTARLNDWLQDSLRATTPIIAVSHGVAGRVLRGLYAGVDSADAPGGHSSQDTLFHMTGGEIKRIAYIDAIKAKP